MQWRLSFGFQEPPKAPASTDATVGSLNFAAMSCKTQNLQGLVDVC